MRGGCTLVALFCVSVALVVCFEVSCRVGRTLTGLSGSLEHRALNVTCLFLLRFSFFLLSPPFRFYFDYYYFEIYLRGRETEADTELLATGLLLKCLHGQGQAGARARSPVSRWMAGAQSSQPSLLPPRLRAGGKRESGAGARNPSVDGSFSDAD